MRRDEREATRRSVSIADDIIEEFAAEFPNLRMTYDEWRVLRTTIECGVEDAILGVEGAADDDVPSSQH